MPRTPNAVSPLVSSLTVFAGVMLIVGGAFQAIEAISAIAHDKYLVASPNYVFALDLTVWGWVHLLVGLALLAIGIFLLRGATWARVAGLVVASLSAFLNFTWLPYAPLWALLVIALDVLVAWALATSISQKR
jgi:hypothetical protein